MEHLWDSHRTSLLHGKGRAHALAAIAGPPRSPRSPGTMTTVTATGTAMPGPWSEVERKQFDSVTYESIMTCTDVSKLRRLERYMVEEGFPRTAAIAAQRLELLGVPSLQEENAQRATRTSDRADVLSELLSWQSQLKSTDCELKEHRQTELVENSAPIRKFKSNKPRLVSSLASPPVSVPQTPSKDVRSGRSYYEAWEKRADTALEQLEAQENEARAPVAPTGSDQVAEVIAAPNAPEPTERIHEHRGSCGAASDALVGVSRLEREHMALREKQKGNELYRAGDFHESVDAYGRALQITPTNAVLYANRAAAQLKRGLPADAEEDCTKALQLDPTYIKALGRRCTARMRLGKTAEAFQDVCQDQHELELTHANELVKLKKKVIQRLPKEPAPPEGSLTAGISTTSSAKRTRICIEESDSEEESDASLNRSFTGYSGPLGSHPQDNVTLQYIPPRSGPMILEEVEPQDCQMGDRGPAVNGDRPSLVKVVAAISDRGMRLSAPTCSADFDSRLGTFRKEDVKSLSNFILSIEPGTLKDLFKDSLSTKGLGAFITVGGHCHEEMPEVHGQWGQPTSAHCGVDRDNACLAAVNPTNV
eukprot:scaffold164_cov409-Prasinococcus_capsulatus_cf.AAC.11